jgi:hypothetical protein
VLTAVEAAAGMACLVAPIATWLRRCHDEWITQTVRPAFSPSAFTLSRNSTNVASSMLGLLLSNSLVILVVFWFWWPYRHLAALRARQRMVFPTSQTTSKEEEEMVV